MINPNEKLKLYSVYNETEPTRYFETEGEALIYATKLLEEAALQALDNDGRIPSWIYTVEVSKIIAEVQSDSRNNIHLEVFPKEESPTENKYD